MLFLVNLGVYKLEKMHNSAISLFVPEIPKGSDVGCECYVNICIMFKDFTK